MSHAAGNEVKLKSPFPSLWSRVLRFLETRAVKQQEAWGASLLVRRRFTSPLEAKRQRRSDD